MTNPLDDYLEKTALFGLSGDKVKEIAGSSLVQFGVGAAVTAAPLVGSKIYNAVVKRHSFNSMMEQNPDLHAEHQQNPTQINQMYNSLYRMNPGFAQDPMVGGAYMRRMVQNPSSAGFTVVESLGKGSPSDMPGFKDAWTAGTRAGMQQFNTGISDAQSAMRRAEEEKAKADPFKAQRDQITGLELKQKQRDLEHRERTHQEVQPFRGRRSP